MWILVNFALIFNYISQPYEYISQKQGEISQNKVISAKPIQFSSPKKEYGTDCPILLSPHI